MISTHKIIKPFMIMIYVSLILLAVVGFGYLYNYLNTGADRSKIMHTSTAGILRYTPNVNWSTAKNEGRQINNQVISEIKRDYLDAWYLKSVVLKTNNTLGIDDYFTKNARKNIYALVNHNKNQNITIESTSLNHDIEVVFFNESAKLVVLKDANVREYKKVFINNKLSYEADEVSTYNVVLLFENNGWRIRHMIKERHKSSSKIRQYQSIDSLKIHGINYYPQALPWKMFGEQFNLNTIENDFKIIRKARLNTIRIFVPYDAFGKANVLPDKLNKLAQVLDLAEKNQLKVVVTLFDFYGNYEVLDWSLTQKHAKAILSRFKNHNAILAWDIKNEPDLDFDSRGKERVLSWLEFMIDIVRAVDQKHWITIGWANAKSAELLKDELDFVTFHYYDNPEKFKNTYSTLKKNIPNKPILLGEFGISSYGGLWNPFFSSETIQANYHKTMQKMLKSEKIPFLSWTLYDFKNIPKGVVGNLPWRKIPQKKYGFISASGRKKAAFNFINHN